MEAQRREELGLAGFDEHPGLLQQLVTGRAGNQPVRAHGHGRKDKGATRIRGRSETGGGERHRDARGGFARQVKDAPLDRAGGPDRTADDEFAAQAASGDETGVLEEAFERVLRLKLADDRVAGHRLQIVKGVKHLDPGLLRKGQQGAGRRLGGQVEISREGAGRHGQQAAEAEQQPAGEIAGEKHSGNAVSFCSWPPPARRHRVRA